MERSEIQKAQRETGSYFLASVLLVSLPILQRQRKATAMMLRSPKVSGGARGLGLTVAQGMLEHGLSKLALLDIDTDELSRATEVLRSQIPERKENIIFKALDVANSEQISQVIQDIAAHFNKIDILACFAGIVNSTRAIDYTAE